MSAPRQHEPEINKLFRLAGRYQADLSLRAGSAPALQIRGVPREALLPPVSPQDLECLVSPLLYAEQRQRLDRGEEVAFTYACEEGRAYRVRVAREGGQLRLSAQRLGVA
jgi:Tfp pilus assembly pilus retraction ATPase PilT